MTGWVGLTAPRGTHPDIVQKLHTEAVAALTAPDVQARLASLGAEVVGSTPATFGQVMAEETRRWSEIVRAAGVKLE